MGSYISHARELTLGVRGVEAADEAGPSASLDTVLSAPALDGGANPLDDCPDKGVCGYGEAGGMLEVTLEPV